MDYNTIVKFSFSYYGEPTLAVSPKFYGSACVGLSNQLRRKENKRREEKGISTIIAHGQEKGIRVSQ